tara:strand:- start:1915 stop:3033 length:1119 start_codon:yes stop_codon:yes gene_type:complete
MKNYSNLGIFNSRGRLYKERPNPFRSPFQRDRDRIIHSASFRRLKHKTQVFVNTEGDHYRTRITHSIEVSQIARTISKYLGLNDDLAETLSLAHDLGHTPFGHAGEEALNECMLDYGGFDHNLQTLRIVMFIENKYFDFQGLNLTLDTLDGLIKHNGPLNKLTKINKLIGLKNFKNKINFSKNASLESQIAAISDDVAYNNHDIQDGIKAKLFTLDDIKQIPFFDQILKSYKTKIKNENKDIIVYQTIRDSINLMVQDLIKTTKINIKENKILSSKDVLNKKFQVVDFSSKLKITIKEIRDFLRITMYNNKEVLKKNNEGKNIIKKLFFIINKNPKKYIEKINIKINKQRAISDYISGMTDRYAIQLYKSTK